MEDQEEWLPCLNREGTALRNTGIYPALPSFPPKTTITKIKGHTFRNNYLERKIGVKLEIESIHWLE